MLEIFKDDKICGLKQSLGYIWSNPSSNTVRPILVLDIFSSRAKFSGFQFSKRREIKGEEGKQKRTFTDQMQVINEWGVFVLHFCNHVTPALTSPQSVYYQPSVQNDAAGGATLVTGWGICVSICEVLCVMCTYCHTARSGHDGERKEVKECVSLEKRLCWASLGTPALQLTARIANTAGYFP